MKQGNQDLCKGLGDKKMILIRKALLEHVLHHLESTDGLELKEGALCNKEEVQSLKTALEEAENKGVDKALETIKEALNNEY